MVQEIDENLLFDIELRRPRVAVFGRSGDLGSKVSQTIRKILGRCQVDVDFLGPFDVPTDFQKYIAVIFTECIGYPVHLVSDSLEDIPIYLEFDDSDWGETEREHFQLNWDHLLTPFDMVSAGLHQPKTGDSRDSQASESLFESWLSEILAGLCDRRRVVELTHRVSPTSGFATSLNGLRKAYLRERLRSIRFSLPDRSHEFWDQWIADQNLIGSRASVRSEFFISWIQKAGSNLERWRPEVLRYAGRFHDELLQVIIDPFGGNYLLGSSGQVSDTVWRSSENNSSPNELVIVQDVSALEVMGGGLQGLVEAIRLSFPRAILIDLASELGLGSGFEYVIMRFVNLNSQDISGVWIRSEYYEG